MEVRIVLVTEEGITEDISKAIEAMVTFYDKGEFVGELFIEKPTKEDLDKEHLLEFLREKIGEIKKVENWCDKAGGNWITHGGHHICVNIKDFSQVPESIRDEAEKNQKRYEKWKYTQAYYKEKGERVTELVKDFEPEDRDKLKAALNQYKLGDLRKTEIVSADATRFKRMFNKDPRDATGGGWYSPFTGTISLNPYNPTPSNLHHEMGHAIYFSKFSEGYSSNLDKMYGSKKVRNQVKAFLASDYCTINPKEFAAEGFEFVMKYPNAAKAYMERDPIAKKYFSQILKDTGYTLRSGK